MALLLAATSVLSSAGAVSLVEAATDDNRSSSHGAFEGSVVLTSDHPVLTSRADVVTDDDLRGITPNGSSAATGWVNLMLQGLRETNGAAIAAPQVGISKRLVVVALTKERMAEEAEEDNSIPTPPVALVNPILRPVDPADAHDVWETCLSVPGQKVVVPRYNSVHYRGQRLDGTHVEGIATGRLAFHLQHEVDHLDGILMTHVAAEGGDVTKARADGLGAVTSTDHWDLMEEEGYDIQTAMFRGAVVVPDDSINSSSSSGGGASTLLSSKVKLALGTARNVSNQESEEGNDVSAWSTQIDQSHTPSSHIVAQSRLALD